MSSDVVYTMYRADKFYGPERQVLSNISLSFLHGAKIGVLGPNGAGKSTLLRIMAGLEEPSSGVAELDPKATVGYLPQEPELDADEGRPRERRGRRARAPRPARPLQRDLGGVRRARRRLRPAPLRPGERAGADRPRGRVEPRPDARPGDGRASASRGRPRRDDALRRRAAARGALPPPPLGTRPAPARRADEPPRRRVGRVARALPRVVQGNRHRGHPRPVLPRQRRRLDPRARSRQGHPVPGELHVLARAEGGAARGRGEAERRPAADAAARARVGPDEPDRAAREVEGATRGVREAPGRGPGEAPGRRRDPHPGRPAARRRRRPRRGCPEGLRRPAARRGPDLRAPARRHRRRDRAERRGQDDALPDDRGRGAAGRRDARGRRHRRARVRRPVAGRPRAAEHRLEGDLRQPGRDRARQARDQLAAVRLVVQLPRRRPAEARQGPLGRRAEPRAPREAPPRRRQPAPPRRADQRPRRRHAPRARGGARRLRRAARS